MPDTFESLRPHLEDYLHERGLNPEKRFRCLNPAHTDRNPSMGFDRRRNKVHCFACGADYDLFDLLALDEGLSSPLEALAEASRRYGRGDVRIWDAPPSSRPAAKPAPKPEAAPAESPTAQKEDKTGPPQNPRILRGKEEEMKRAEPLPKTAKTQRSGISAGAVPPPADPAYLSLCAARAGETGYFARRGLSKETVQRFGLGYDPERRCVVLPCAGGRAVRRSIEKKRYLNEKGVPSPLFQPELLEGDGPVFLAEGTFDALSAEELGYPCAALNGSGNREKAAALLRGLGRPAPVLLLPDNDRAGDEWAGALQAEFPWLERCPPLPAGKDLNELLCADRAAAAAFLAGCAADWKKAHPPYRELSAAGRMPDFLRYVAAVRPALPTGFRALDRALDGGLYEGLYVLGAVSSLGKTAFCMQIADQIAAAGTDVLIFTLEMSAFELMARSISRETFQADGTRGRTLSKTVRGVLDARRREKSPARELAHLEEAQARYAAYAERLWFVEGDHETGLEAIRQGVERHIAETGRRPVVLVDYLQIIAPSDVHFTDKQNLDRAVCALKKLSRSHGLTVLSVSSFNRENYNLEVSMSAFKESGGIDYSADVLLGLQARGAGSRSFNLDEEKRKDPRELELKILKNRSAALGDPVPFRYYPAFSCFEEG